MSKTIRTSVVSLLWVVAACSGDDRPDLGDSAASMTSGASMTMTSAMTGGASDSVSSGADTEPSTVTSPTSTSGGTGAESTGCTFLACGDGGTGDTECDVWNQDCPDMGGPQKCAAWANDGGTSWNATKCVPVAADPDSVGDPCTVEGSGVSGIDSCEKGAMCWNSDESGIGYCVGLCVGNEVACTEQPGSCCQDDFACTIANEGTLILCLAQCDPLTQDCQGNNEVCYPVGDAFQCAPNASPADMGNAGDPCEFINGCNQGTFCNDPGLYPGCSPDANGCCIPFCDLDAPECPMAECKPYFDVGTAPPGYENLGYCGIM